MVKSKTHSEIFIYEDDFDEDAKIKYSAPANHSLRDPDWNGKRNHYGESQNKENNLTREDMLEEGTVWRQPL